MKPWERQTLGMVNYPGNSQGIPLNSKCFGELFMFSVPPYFVEEQNLKGTPKFPRNSPQIHSENSLIQHLIAF